MILKGFSYTVIGLSLLVLFVSSKLTFLLGILYALEQAVHNNMVEIPNWDDTDKIKKIVLVNFVLFASICLSYKPLVYQKKEISVRYWVMN